MLRLAIEPPQYARPGVPLWPPVSCGLSSRTSIYSELAQTWAVATLVHYSGEVLYDQLGGKVADSAHPLPESGHHSSSSSSNHSASRDRAYFFFPDLVINEPGRYRIRVSLMQMDYSIEGQPEGVVRVLESIDSRSVTVEEGVVYHSRPSGFQGASKSEINC